MNCTQRIESTLHPQVLELELEFKQGVRVSSVPNLNLATGSAPHTLLCPDKAFRWSKQPKSCHHYIDVCVTCAEHAEITNSSCQASATLGPSDLLIDEVQH